MDPIVLTLLVLLFVIIGFFSGKMSYAVVAVVALTILQIGGVLSPAEAWSGFANTSVVLVVALFVVGGGFAKTSLITRMKIMLNGFEGKDRTVIWATMGVAMLLSVVTASSIAMATLIPIIISLTDGNAKLSRTQLLKTSSDMTSIWTGTFPLGMAAGAYMMFNQIVENLGGTPNFTIFDMTLAKIIPVLACTLWQFFVGYKLCNREPNAPLKDFGIKSATLPDGKLTTLTPFQDKFTIIMFIFSVVGMIFVSLVPIVPTYIIAIIAALGMVLCGALNEKEAFGSIAWNIVFMYAGMLPLSTALSNSGAATVIGSSIQALLGGTTNPYVITGAFFLVSMILTQFMSNTAVSTIFQLLAAVTAINMGLDPRAAILAGAIGSTVSVMTPMASPNQTMTFGTGGYKMTDFVKAGLPLMIIFFVVYVITAPLFFPF